MLQMRECARAEGALYVGRQWQPEPMYDASRVSRLLQPAVDGAGRGDCPHTDGERGKTGNEEPMCALRARSQTGAQGDGGYRGGTL